MPKLTKHHLGVLLAAGSGLLLFGASAAMAMYLQKPLQLSYHLTKIPIQNAIEVDFNQEVNSQLNYNLQPGIPGKWTTKRGLIGITAIVFHPTHPLLAGSSYKLVLGSIKKISSSQPEIGQQTIAITTEPPADIKSVTPANGATNVPVASTISVRLAAPNHGLRNLQLTSDAPTVLRDPASTDDQTFTWKLASPLAEGTTYHLHLADLNQTNPLKRQLANTSFTTVPEPQVTTATQTNHFYPGNTLTIGFDQPMRQVDSAFQFNFPGSGHWTSPTSYQFTPGSLTPGTSYTYAVLKGAAATNGGVTLTNHTYSISPPGAAYVTGSTPGGSNLATTTTISFTFDQPVDHAGAQAAFSLSPAATGSFTWSGNTMSFHSAGLGYQTGYTATVGAGVKGTYGLASTRAFSDSFTTTYQVITLNVPLYHQQYAESCEEASLRMVLAFYGINVQDYDILGRVGYSPRSRDTSTNSWDNPYQMFVGDVNGVQDTTGYGVFAPPIASAAQSYGRGATVAAGASAGYIAQQIHNGHPVIAWGYSVHPSADSWNTPQGPVATYKGEHVRVVYGVAGNPNNIIGFYIHDPVYGNLYWTPAQLMSNMNIFGATSNQTVTVY